MSRDELSEKVIIVAGASSGVGAAVARSLAAEGARVALVARRTEQLAHVAAACGSDRALAITADVTDEADVGRAVDETVRHFGRLDGLILNAAVGLVGGVEHFAPADWRRTFATNVESAYLLSRAAIPHLRPTHGTIIAVGSEFSRAVMPGLAAYAASKWALLALMQTLALELRGDGVKVSSVLPGGILTDFGPDSAEGKRERQSRGERFLQPEDVAAAVTFLLKQPEGAWTQELNLLPR